MASDARDIARLLAARIEMLARELFPAGRREGNELKLGSMAGEAGRSLSICLRGTKAGVWADFASGQGGDALDLVAEALYRGDKRQALAWARRWLGLSDDTAAEPARPAQAPPDTSGKDAERRTAFAWRVFEAAEPRLAGTPADLYLRGRAIDLRELGRQPRALRFHPALACAEVGRDLPAMVAAVTGPDGRFVAVHRTWLEQRPDGWGKAALAAPKKVLGSLRGGCIRLWRGASGVPLAQAAEGEVVLLAEGIETGLSIAMACPERRILAAVSVGNLAQMVLPEAVREVVIAADNDAPGSQASTALQCAIDRFAREGRTVKVARSPVGSDFNDGLMEV
jgi:hypothetical protein